ncbi:acetylglucosamine transferase [Limnohabitans sp. TS-CS-82]|uniref:O-linked N-acetylglucosamine transferase, SPINDLY family protein n=1 Tax=Limnohabitans sp. TS-CS-82 TaxID=2094193 RepID=UPI000CF1CAF5|nr:acetylglucosamine transferase [Limnohabitans sp. TS-CS-82]PQA81588.1 acetylglucosamine transferase [Limnohabitans sp. TS-CS-82]
MHDAETATARRPLLEDLIPKVEKLCALGHQPLAVKMYRDWLEGYQGLDRYIALFNLGVLLFEQSDWQGAQAVYAECCQLVPAFALAKVNLGLVYERQGLTDLALQHWLEVAAAPGTLGETAQNLQRTTLNHVGRVQETLKNYAEAEDAMTQSLVLQPDQPDVLQHWVFLRMKQCKWPVFQDLPGLSPHMQLCHTSPLAMLALFDDPALQLLAARQIVQRKYSGLLNLPAKTQTYKHRKIRIGYVSGDLCTHAVGLLLPEVIEAHDRRRFEVIAFDHSPEDGSACRQRLKQAFHRWVPIHHLSDAEAVQVILSLEVDVLIDLHGLSLGARPGIFAARPAQLQGTYLGFMGTTAMPWLDFVVTDAQACPEQVELLMAERPLVVDGCFIPLEITASVQRPLNTEACTRVSEGLPKRAFVLGCFNNIYKINNEMFSAWMQILIHTDNTVLWLLDDNPVATASLKAQVLRHGVDAQRVIFASRTSYVHYCERLRLVDLYLDTFPYNAGSTARDVLAAGVPLLTRRGKTLVSRMAASMLHALGLNGLICDDLEQYQAQAIHLASSRSRTRYWARKLNHALNLPDAKHGARTMVASLEQKLKTWLKSRNLPETHGASTP